MSWLRVREIPTIPTILSSGIFDLPEMIMTRWVKFGSCTLNIDALMFIIIISLIELSKISAQ